MGSLLQPADLFFIMIVALILFGPGKLRDLGEGLRRASSDLRGEWNALRGALFMAKGVDPAVGRDVGNMLPEEDARRSRMWLRCLLAILIGHTLYLGSSPLLPDAARMNGESSLGLPALVDLWLCLFVFGVLNLAALVRGRSSPKS
jgi:hypothetical protein